MGDKFEQWELLNNALEQSRREARLHAERLSSWQEGDTVKDHLVRETLLRPLWVALAENAAKMAAEETDDEAVERAVYKLVADEGKIW